MNNAVNAILAVALLIAWIAGVVLAVGWMKLLASLFPFYAWYLVVEKVMEAML